MSLRESLVASTKYETPWPVIHWLEKRYGITFDLDPCCEFKTRKAGKYFDEKKDGLKQDWFGNVFMNPPWDNTTPLFLERAYSQNLSGNTSMIVGLVPVRSDTAYWHEYVLNGGSDELILIRGRIKFYLDGVLQGRPDMKNVCAFPVWIGNKRRRTQPKLYAVDVKEFI